VTLNVLAEKYDDEYDEKLKVCLSFMKILLKANQKARHVPISEFYNDAGLYLSSPPRFTFDMQSQV
jgi:hypothetical protein